MRSGPKTQDSSRRRHVPASAITAFVDPSAIDTLLRRWVPEDEARAFVVRCILGEGPAHHRGANFVLLRLLGLVLERMADEAPDDEVGEQVAIPIRLPPRLADGHDDGDYPLGFPRRLVAMLAPDDAGVQAAMIDCLTDGPPQHALANAAMLCLFDALLQGKPRR
jgi:hypothetical protein